MDPQATSKPITAPAFVFSGRFTKIGGRAVRPDPQVDQIFALSDELMDPDDANRRMEMELPLPINQKVSTQGLVTLMVPSDGTPLGTLPLEITLNGERYLLPRDVMATVPKEIAALIMNSANGNTKTPAFAVDGKGKVIAEHNPGDWLQSTNLTHQDQSRFRVFIDRED